MTQRIILALVGALVIIAEFFTLSSYPVPDSGNWFGDESWTVLTLRELAHSGVARIPEALGSSLSISNGFVNGCVWISGLIYGLPLSLTRNCDPVIVGRIITQLLAILMVYVLYRTLRSIGVQSKFAVLACLLLIASPIFTLASHSARLDLITGLAVVAYLYLILELSQRETLPTIWFFGIPALAVCTFTVYVHAPTLIALPSLFALWKFGVLRSGKRVAAALAGYAIPSLAIAATYYLTTGTFTVLGSGYNQYFNVANSLPILHPFSWQVQKINTIDRAVQTFQVAWPLLITLAVVLPFVMIRRTSLVPAQRFALELAVLIAIGWMLFEGPAIYYQINFAPILALCAGIGLQSVWPKLRLRTIALNSIGLLVIFFITTVSGYQIGRKLSQNNEAAASRMLDHVRITHPVILTDEPAYHIIAKDSECHLMTGHFRLFGMYDSPMTEILRKEHVTHLLLYSVKGWKSPFQAIADSLGTLVATEAGDMTDITRTYTNPKWNDLDTLRLYTFQ